MKRFSWVLMPSKWSSTTARTSKTTESYAKAASKRYAISLSFPLFPSCPFPPCPSLSPSACFKVVRACAKQFLVDIFPHLESLTKPFPPSLPFSLPLPPTLSSEIPIHAPPQVPRR